MRRQLPIAEATPDLTPSERRFFNRDLYHAGLSPSDLVENQAALRETIDPPVIYNFPNSATCAIE